MRPNIEHALNGKRSCIRIVLMLATILGLPGLLGIGWAQPSARGYVQMTYDSQSDRIVLFGGQTGDTASVSGETWVFDPAKATWERRNPNPAPPPLGDANLAYDEESDLVVLWGGIGPGVTHATELWTYDTDANSWNRIEQDADSSPFGRVGSRLAYDSESDLIVLFGGCSVGTGYCFDETWTLDIDTGTWARLEIEDGPEGRNFHQLAYHPGLDRTFLWGGDVDGIFDKRMWTFDAQAPAWQAREILAEAPIPRYYGGMAYLEQSGDFLMYGGGNSGNDQTWIYDPVAHAWTQLEIQGPGKRSRFALTAAGGHGVYLFGGQLDKNAFDYERDMWRFDPTTSTWSTP